MNKYILVDSTGSMSEEGKKSIVKYLIYSIKSFLLEEWKEENVDIYLFGEEIKPYESKIIFQGKANSESLKRFLVDKKDSQILLLSDGCYSEPVKKVFIDSGTDIWAIMIGCDCNKAVLQRIVGKERVFDTIDMVASLYQFMNFEKG